MLCSNSCPQQLRTTEDFCNVTSTFPWAHNHHSLIQFQSTWAVSGKHISKMPQEPFFPRESEQYNQTSNSHPASTYCCDRAHLWQRVFLLHSDLPSGLLINTATCAHRHGDCAYVSHASLYSPCLATHCCAKDVCISLNTC